MKLFNGDCLEVMQDIPDSSVDLIITSPPYEDISGAGYQANKKDILFLKLYSEFLDKVFTHYERILKDGGQLFFNIKSKTANKTLRSPHWLEFTDAFQKLDFKSYIIWKYAGSFDSTKARFHLDYEIIYHLSKGDNIYLNTDCGIDDPLTSVWYVPHNIPKAERVHPTQMPIALAERILTIASKEGNTVLDNFMGSGTTGVASKKFDLDFIGIELDENNFKLAEKRINEV
jgi:DNA modification methylase|tara:strand:+ start:815 stop:1504 length:690 start_codon:yes stop_codon:yes gene_type:complete